MIIEDRIKKTLFIFTVFLLMNYFSMRGSGFDTTNAYIKELFTFKPSTVGMWGANIFFTYIVYFFTFKRKSKTN